MQMLHIYYKGKNPRHILLLLLVKDDDYIIGLDSAKITDSDRRAIKLAGSVTVDWLKRNCPASYKKGFRKLYTSKCNVLNSYELNNV